MCIIKATPSTHTESPGKGLNIFRLVSSSTSTFIHFIHYLFGGCRISPKLCLKHPHIPTVGKIVPPVVPAALKTIDVEVPVWPWHVSQDQRWEDHSRDPNLDPNKMGSGFIPSYTHLQPWLNRVCWGYNYITTRGAPSWTKPNSKFPIGSTDFPWWRPPISTPRIPMELYSDLLVYSYRDILKYEWLILRGKMYR